MTVAVPLEELQAELDRRAAVVYLLTVADSGRPHCVAVRLGWRDGELEIRTGTTSARNADARPGVTLLAPPPPGPARAAAEEAAEEAEEAEEAAEEGASAGAETSGYSLIVDGDVTAITMAPEGGVVVRVRPTHAVFHRPAQGPGGAPVHDCVPVFDQPAGSGEKG